MNLVSISEAAEILQSAKRVMVMGCSGSGKSTLSLELAQRLDLHYISMDRDILWLPGWQLRDRAEQLDLMVKAVAGERWVFDGSGPRSMEIRLARAEFAIWMRPPRLSSIKGVLLRWLRYMGRVRPAMAPGCPEKMDLEFLAYIWNFERDHAPSIEEQFALNGQDVPVLMLKSHQETAALLALLHKAT
ncbi:AAA family ATPase [Rhizobium sp. L1K21]|uniref:AAA family ATPase n=1 Tax=Rhizobium sp. L1K21 TaxID=2954933 RepID=UPI002092A1C6|nr:AAA family ATPase [Rhizobium sp. L1K21]MCO6185933.1 AAA family ATPase [Rhizobium sp. L1K21]